MSRPYYPLPEYATFYRRSLPLCYEIVKLMSAFLSAADLAWGTNCQTHVWGWDFPRVCREEPTTIPLPRIFLNFMHSLYLYCLVKKPFLREANLLLPTLQWNPCPKPFLCGWPYLDQSWSYQQQTNDTKISVIHIWDIYQRHMKWNTRSVANYFWSSLRLLFS